MNGSVLSAGFKWGKYIYIYIPRICNKNQQNAHWSMAGCVYPAIDQTTYMDAWKTYHRTARTSLPEDENLDVSKHVEDTTIKLKH